MSIFNYDDENHLSPELKQLNAWNNVISGEIFKTDFQCAPSLYNHLCNGVISRLSQGQHMYLCGLLTEEQYDELMEATHDYLSERACMKMNGVSFDLTDIEKIEKTIKEIPLPQLQDLKPYLENEAFFSPMMKLYTLIADRMQCAWEIADLDNLNINQEYINLEDGHGNIQILAPEQPFVSHAVALKTLLCVRNGCFVQSSKANLVLHIASEKFYENTLSMLKQVPEDKLTKGTSERAKLAHDYWMHLAPASGVTSQSSFLSIMFAAVEEVHTLLTKQNYLGTEWRDWQVKWFESCFRDYIKHFAEQVVPQKSDEKQSTPVEAVSAEQSTKTQTPENSLAEPASQLKSDEKQTTPKKVAPAKRVTKHQGRKNPKEKDNPNTRA